MHSYLLVGENNKKIEVNIDSITAILNSSRIDFTLEKINEVRSLISYARLSLNKPTTIVIKNIDKASHAALNAFLKKLEEPQKNLSFILTTSSIQKLLPTIISRCQVIRLDKTYEIDINMFKKVGKFYEMKESERLQFISSIRSREDALSFIKGVVLSTHKKFKVAKNLSKQAKLIKVANSTYENLEKNGNVSLQLSNFVLQT